MSELAALWMPILVSAVAVFFASFVSWVLIGHHNPDWRELANESDVADWVRDNIRPGRYLFPCARTKEQMENESKKQLLANGPWGTINIWDKAPNMGKNLGLTFSFYLVTSFFVAYLATISLDPGAGFGRVFQVTGTAAILAHCFAFMPNNIWFGTPKRAILFDVLDGVVYAMITAAIFGAMWPTA